MAAVNAIICMIDRYNSGNLLLDLLFILLLSEAVKTILFVIGNLGLGGAERQMFTLIRELKIIGYHCHVFVLQAEGPIRELLIEEGVPIHDGAYHSVFSRGSALRALVRAQWNLVQTIRALRPDIVHAFLPLTNFMAALAGQLLGVRLIITSRRALNTHQDRQPLWKPFDRLAYHLSHRVTVNSKAVWQDTVARDRVKGTKLALIYNGINAQRFERIERTRTQLRADLHLTEADIAIVKIGNLIPYKGHADLLQAMVFVVERHPQARLFCVGEDRGELPSLQRLAGDLGIASHVQFLGGKEDIAPWLSAMDMAVIASHEEGFSNAVLEAMVAGLSVVATRVGGNPEALENGRLGILANPRDPVDLAKAISEVIDNFPKWRSIAKKARHHVYEKYSVAAMANAYVKLYENGEGSYTLNDVPR